MGKGRGVSRSHVRRIGPGVRAAMEAQRRFGVERAEDEEIVCVTENDACGVDGIQFVLGCTWEREISYIAVRESLPSVSSAGRPVKASD